MAHLLLLAAVWIVAAGLAACVWSLTARHHKKGGPR